MDDTPGTPKPTESSAGDDAAGVGHNRPAADWARWTKKRTFVRALEGTYGEMMDHVYDQPRVYPSKDHAWHGGPQSYGKEIINPADAPVAQSIETHLKAFGPYGTNVNHGHLNSAAFYVMRGRGYDIHNGERFDYDAGDMLMVPNGVVHQHFNDDHEEMLVLIMKAKPLFLFMHMVFQKNVKLPPNEATKEQLEYEPPTDY